MLNHLDQIDASDLMQDVYFKAEFINLYSAPDATDIVATPDYVHGAAIRLIPGTTITDLETPHGYGGPIAKNPQDIGNGLNDWRKRQEDAGHVAEFIRLHPFINATVLQDYFDHLVFNRQTVIVNLETPNEQRRKYYSKGTRHALGVAEKKLTVRQLEPQDWPTFEKLHEITLVRNCVPIDHHFSAESYKTLMALPWTTAWAAEIDNVPVAAACFLSSNQTLCHYHFSGGGNEARNTKANYLLLETAFEYYANLGRKWMHLGGGRTALPDDTLFDFKSKFSPDRAAYYTGGIIFSKKLYNRLGGVKNGRFLGYRTTP